MGIPVNKQAHRTENIIFPQLLTGVNNHKVNHLLGLQTTRNGYYIAITVNRFRKHSTIIVTFIAITLVIAKVHSICDYLISNCFR